MMIRKPIFDSNFFVPISLSIIKENDQQRDRIEELEFKKKHNSKNGVSHGKKFTNICRIIIV